MTEPAPRDVGSGADKTYFNHPLMRVASASRLMP